MLNVLMTSPSKVVFEGGASRVIAPGEVGTFEVLPLHRGLVSRLVAGPLIVDNTVYPIVSGVLSVANDQVTLVVEMAQ